MCIRDRRIRPTENRTTNAPGINRAAPVSYTHLGQFAALGLITAGTSYVEMACTQLIINLRYFLMSCALSQKLDPNMHFFHRLLVAYGVTDEIFGISIGSGRMLNPFYAYGAISVAAPSWTCLLYTSPCPTATLPTGFCRIRPSTWWTRPAP